MNLPYRGLTLICAFCLFTELMVMGLSTSLTPYTEMVAAALHSVDYYLYLAGLITHSRKLLKQSMQRKMGPKYDDLVYDKFAVYLTSINIFLNRIHYNNFIIKRFFSFHIGH